MNSNSELPAWMQKTYPGKRTSAYTAKPKAKKKRTKVKTRREQMERQTQGKEGRYK